MPKIATEKSDAAGKRKTIDSYFNPTKKQASKGSSSEKSAKPSRSSTPSASKGNGKGKETMVKKQVPKDHPELKLEYETIDPSWLEHLEREFTKPYFTKLKRFLQEQADQGKTIFPLARDVYSWSRYAPLDKVRVVILGQDPYHGPGQAHGLAFSVRPQVKTPPSLANMYKALARDYPEFQRPAHGYLRGWAQQGVLLLNAALTVECHKANAHANRGWEQFTDRVVSLVNEHNKNVVFMLWGSYAQKKGAHLDKTRHCVLTTVHPSPLSASRGFFDAAHFRRANEYLESHGLDAIDWSYLPAEEKDTI
ncbi:uracil DNA glycosylase [Coemansia sp. RSA 1813]|nr:uracil DNA glycosylase [Coemansia sp. RSA 1646]KAJ1766512.1 uracil DNA glycosylase [Coemansia sp. RSA 1843]KAJ2085648.1 uracil DNA glycosylase [Coemansia sp. RSA 986]KAJ2210541.1 uracil DNA glycosylase [Coemansia sp. RSA 487]KAJ2563183.1 uracil DNA glycosylase [Coemansia sp. RSA 1813]